MTKILLTTTALSLAFAGSALAGGVPILPEEEETVVEERPGSSGLLLPLLALAVVGVLVSSGGGDDAPPEEEDDDSDLRLKRDLRPVGVAENGLSMYRFRYIDRPGEYIGVMTQDVEQQFPDAVSQRPDGFLRVNYKKLGMQMKRVA